MNLVLGENAYRFPLCTVARRPLKGHAPGRPPLERLSNDLPGARRTPVNTALAWIRGTRTSTRGI